ncbi:RHS repeat-associated core domain-containing protein [Streptomyces sp. CA-210063]|nr:RHS repeat-associated core domain-containing protein [Streptomyces sp. CA-210063]
MLSGLLTPVAFAAEADPLGAPDVPAPRGQKVSPFKPKVDKKAAAAVEQAEAADRSAAARAREERQRTVTWPKAGQATVTLPAKGSTRATPGSLPVTLSKPRKGKAPNSVTVKVLDQKTAAGLGVRGVVLEVKAAKGDGGAAQLALNYDAFASAYGGDWAGRLRLQSLPACALTDRSAAKCRTRETLDFTNDRSTQRLSAPVTLSADGAPTMLAVAAGTSSGGGDYKATPLSASSTWEAGGSAGTFTWSYPLRVPPSAAGPKPDMSISYDSGSVDGQTSTTNNQGTAIGTGFDLTSSYIERKYGSCDDDGQTDKFDLCWKFDNASLVLNGKATELVKDDTSGKWRLKNDDASTVTHSTAADNGDDNGEHWTVTTGDGTKYVFGRNKLEGAGADERTNSVWTVPVFGDDSGEPGYSDGTNFSGRDKKQAWRWNLDYVEDTHGNAMTYWYTAETNNYDMLGDDTTGTRYTRGGHLKEIRYGQRADALFSATPAASNKVVFSYAERCVASGTGCDELTEDARDNWPDVPFDAVCKDDDKCTGNVGPSFFTRKRMTGITTYAWNAAASTPAYDAVDAWSLKQIYLDPGDTGDSSDQSLWLDEIRHTGKRGTELSLDPVKFGHDFRKNRVDGAGDNILPLYRPRLATVTSETGAKTVVTYADADCVAGQAKPKVDENTRNCYPVYWSPNGEKEPILDWFQKYPVTSVYTSDPQGGSESVQHAYQYSGGGAWHYNEDPFTKEKERTWSVWRGFGKVTHITGAPNGTQSKTVTVYLRGMNGDRVLGADGKTPHKDDRKSVKVTGVKAPALTDSDQYAGLVRETVTYNGADEVSGTVNDPWSKKTATQHKSYADTEAYYVRTEATHTRTNITSKLTPYDRVRTVKTTFDDYGMPETVEDRGDNAVEGDETCTRTWYARNADNGINSLTSRVRKVAKSCAIADSTLDLPSDSNRPGDVIADTATVYDDATATAWSAVQKPTKGEAVWVGRAKGYGSDDAPTWQKASTSTYDSLGRPRVVKDTNDQLVTDTAYVPTATGPLTSTSVSNVKGHKTTSVVDFATGSPTKITDPNNKITETTYDSLGRTTQVWLPNRLRVLNFKPNYVFGYHVTSKASEMSWVSTATLVGNSADRYKTTYEFFDSMLRTRQVQTPTPSGGRLISLSLYDSRGLVAGTRSDIWEAATEPSTEPAQPDGGQAPIETNTTYDGAGRAIKAVTSGRDVSLKEKPVIRRLTVDTTYTGDTVATSAPAGGQAVAVVTDALGRTTERREYGGPQPTGSDYTTTRYAYTPAGQQETIIGPDEAKWSYTYDLFGRQITATDPDKGTSKTTYDGLDRVDSTFNVAEESKKLLYGYDELNRKTGLWQSQKTDANKLASWGYDAVAKGQQDTAVRYDGSITNAYTQKVTTFDNLYNATASELQLPASEPLVAAGLAKTLPFSSSYNLDSSLGTVTEPAAGGLAAEKVSYTYTVTGQVLSAAGSTNYLQDAGYSPQGDLTQLRLGRDPTSSAKKAYVNFTYEPGFRRLTRAYVTDDVHAYMPQDLNFTQDDAGNVTSIFDGTTQGGTTKPDYQCFSYDGHRRLTESWTPKTADCATAGRTTANIDGQAPYWTSYTYTAAGQRKTETQHATSGNSTTTYTYDDTSAQGDNKPHTLDNTTGARAATYDYDANGNTESRPGPTAQQTLAWNAEGKLAKTTEGSAETGYLYDANGELLIRRAKGNGDTVLYLGGTEVRLTVKGATKTLSGTRYYTAGGQSIAVRTAVSGTSGSKLSFLASDHHGTSSIALDATTYAVTKRYTSPFGASRDPKAVTGWPDDKAFLGKPADVGTGLTHIGAREYDPKTGQFISVDPLLELDKHQTLNGYTYSINNPVTFSDPSGLGLKCGGPNDPACPKRPDGTEGNGRPNEAVDYTKPASVHPCNSNCGTATTDSTGTTNGPGDSEDGCGSWGFLSGVCSGVGETFYGVVSNVPHMAEYGGWIFDGDCRNGGGPGEPGCDYGAQFDNWIAGHGYDTSSDAYQVPSALAAIFGHRPGKPGSSNKSSYARWKVGDDYTKPNKKGKSPTMSTMRKRFWKNEAAEPAAEDQWGKDNIERMKRGSAPQRMRPDGTRESMELSHEPVPDREGGMLLTPRWPDEHALIDPYRHLPKDTP